MRQCKVYSGGDDTLGALLYKPPSQHVVDYFKTSMSNIISSGANLGKQFMDVVTDIYKNSYSEEAVKHSKNLINMTSMHTRDDVIFAVSVDNYRPNLEMQKYIMSLPMVDNMVYTQRFDGFSSTGYIDLEPDNHGTERHSYMAVMTGVIDMETEEDSFAIQYSFGDEVVNTELEFSEKISVLNTWDSVKKLIAMDIDPTDI